MHACRTKIDDGRDPRRQDEVATRTVGDADACATESLHFIRVRHHTVRDPRAVRAPSRLFEIVSRTTSEGGKRKVIVLGVLCKVCVQTNVEFLGQTCRVDHQLLGHAERTARSKRNPHHRAVRAIVMALDRPLGLVEDHVVVLNDGVRWQTTVLH